MKTEEAIASTSQTTTVVQKSSSSTSAFARLCRKLSPKRDEPRPSLTVVPNYSSETTSSLERVFNYIDEDKDGKISPAELQSCLRTVGLEDLSSEDAEAVVESSDSDGDGLLGFEDFVKLVEVEGEEERLRSLREAFGMYEMGGAGGCITPKSLKRMLSRLGERRTMEECKTMIRRFDLNGDGVISFDEFKLMML
ncbi:Calcium-binding protein CML38 [Acorus gramineus]|uniref:Calcium-binding protein CML38 n=1 Tax=Acorus gramineus TaxID=55184 RepID=A0AAV9AGL3_ACOGR|nr:Calcium-binding protein CML38 [Acorus gramineus]